MSTTNTIDQLATQLQTRLPIGLTQATCFSELNKAWQWVEQKGAYIWNVRFGSMTVNFGATAPASIPADWDFGKPASIYPSIGLGLIQYEIRYLPFDEFVRQQTFHFTPPAGCFSCWTFTGSPTSIIFAPASAAPPVGGLSYFLYYHHTVGPPLVTTQYFPTPDAFDQTLVDLAEGELRRYYSLSGAADVQKKAENSAQILMDKYRSPKRDIAGLTEMVTESQEKKAE